MKSLQIIYVVVLSVILIACVAPQKNWNYISPIFMVENARHKIGSTRVVVGLNADSRLGPPLVASGNSGQQGGLIGALIESAIVHGQNDTIQEKQRHLTEINNALLTFNFGSAFRQAVQDKVKPLEWLHVTYITKQQDFRIGDITRLLTSIDEDALLVIDCKYIMADDYSKLNVYTHVTLNPKRAELVKIAKQARPNDQFTVLYENLFKFVFPYDGTFLNPNDAIAGWSNNNGDMIHRALTASINDLTQQIISDMSAITVGANMGGKQVMRESQS